MATKAKKKEEAKEPQKVVTGFKGFDSNLKCKTHQYEVGKEYVHDGPVSLCQSGFHFCENPIDVFDYYPPADSRYAEIEAEDVSDREGGDSKRVCKKIHIKAEITLKSLIEAAIKFTFDRVDWKDAKESNSGPRSAATNTGPQSAATNTGYRSAATNTGPQSAATNTGPQSAATNTGDRSAATNTGYQSAATNTGDRSAATNTGPQSAATNTGYRSAATNTGPQGAATNTGPQSAATNTGPQSAATNTGYQSAATNTGDRSAATNTGKEGCAISLGIEGRAKGAVGCWLTLAEWEDRSDGWHRINVKTAQVDGKQIKPDIFYMLKSGEFVEAPK